MVDGLLVMLELLLTSCIALLSFMIEVCRTGVQWLVWEVA
jgi:hypothetical protein